MKQWHTLSIEACREEFGTDPARGLTDEQHRSALESCGPNQLSAGKRKSLISMILAQFNNLLTIILIGAALVSGFLGEIPDAIIILAVIAINTIIGVTQESKAEEALAALKRISSPKALVKRDGETREVPTEELVPGDLILLEAGRVVPADIRLTESADLKIDESALTGESVPAEKRADASPAEEAPVGDRLNMAYMSTLVSYGRGEGIVVATGMETEIGKIATMLETAEEERTPLQKKLDSFGRILGLAILGLCALMFAVGFLREYMAGEAEGEAIFELFFTAVSLAVAAIPEGLTAIVTIVLAMGVTRMSRRNAIIRTLPAVETLGAVTTICSDKTGTLTQNRMTVRKTYTAGETRDLLSQPTDAERKLLKIMALCNDATLTTGDPTEIALVAAAERADLKKSELDASLKREDELPFDSERKMMTTVHRSEEGVYLVCTKGATDELLERCDRVLGADGILPLDRTAKEAITASAEELSSRALRVLSGAYKEIDALDGEYESNLIYAGFQGMIDPPREEVKQSIAEAKEAGITPVMITGDHKSTATAIARELRLVDSGRTDALSGTEIDKLNQDELVGRCGSVRVFARVSPEHKVRIVDAFQERGEVVSMTGDGVNDGPSLKAADIGVAMGKSGTDVAKGASDMVLTDDNFSTIVSAVREGRNIYTNIKKTIGFLLSCNAGEIVAVFTAVILGWASPLRPTHILWVNLITDTFPALALGVDSDDPDAMQRPPRPPKESLFAGGTGKTVVLNGLLIGLITLGVFAWGLEAYDGSLIHARTLAFAVLSISQLVHAFNLRHPRHLLWELKINPYLFLALIGGGALQVGVIMIPGVAGFFGVVPLSGFDWLLVGGLALIPLFLNEGAKLIRKMLGFDEKT